MKKGRGWFICVLFLAQMVPGPASAISANEQQGTWKSIEGPQRYYHTATRLRDGRVLVAGGCTNLKKRIPKAASGTGFFEACEPATSLELYDPKTREWSAVGRFLRFYHTATPLSDGRILFAGGCLPTSCHPGNDYAKIYDPQKKKLSGTGPPVEFFKQNWPRHTATLLSNGPEAVCGANCGKVLIVDPLSAQSFDPQTGEWSAAGSGPTGSHVRLANGADGVFGNHHTATLLSTGQVLIHGAVSALFDPLTEKWLPTGQSPIKKEFHSATALKDGRVLIAGGLLQRVSGTRRSYAGSSSAELYDPLAHASGNNSPARGAFVPTQELRTARGAHSSALLEGGKVLIAGGGNAGNLLGTNRLSSAEIFDPVTGRWRAAAPMNIARGGIASAGTASPPTFTTTVLEDGSVLVIGGAPSGSVDIYYTSASTPAQGPLPNGGKPLGVALILGGSLFVGLLLFLAWKGRSSLRMNTLCGVDPPQWTLRSWQ